MGILVVVSFLFFILLTLQWYRFRVFDLSSLLISIYLSVSILGIIYYKRNALYWDITWYIHLYLFAVIFLFMRPYLTDNQQFYDRFSIRNSKRLSVFSWLYIGSSIVAIYYQIPIVKENLISSDWAHIRDALYYEEDFKLYNNQIERFAKIYIQYFRLPAILALFYYLCKPGKILFKLFLTISIVFPTLFSAIITAGRGSLFAFTLELTTGYFIFKKGIPYTVKRYIKYLALVLLSTVMVFVLSVSNSRFGSSFLSSSLLHYFSHSFLAFNYGVADSITDFAYGKYFFNKIFGSIPLDFDYLGTHFDTSFITFVGTLYIDFGPIGTFLIAMIIPVFFNGIIKRRKRIDFSDL